MLDTLSADSVEKLWGSPSKKELIALPKACPSAIEVMFEVRFDKKEPPPLCADEVLEEAEEVGVEVEEAILIG